MAYIEPKTNWAAGNIPVASDFNRIEGNTKQNHDDIVAEVAVLTAGLASEISTRDSADTSLQTQVNTKATKAAIGDNGGVGSVVTITSTVVAAPPLYDHTWTLPRSGIWLSLVSPASIVNGSSLARSYESQPAGISGTFWQIG